jgi:hypothetical protein
MDHHLVAARSTQTLFGDVVERYRRPLIIANPSSDRQFRKVIDTALRSGNWRPEELEALLRTQYPRAVVRPRELAGEQTPVWYVYRDGHWIKSELDAES